MFTPFLLLLAAGVILGHSANTVAANYGSGYAIEVMREALVKVWGSEVKRSTPKADLGAKCGERRLRARSRHPD